MEEFTNEFALARNYGFDITMPEGAMGLSSAAHMEYMNKCTALYRHFLSNMNSIIRFEKETKKGLRKLHREKMENLRFSLYRSENAGNGNDPFAKLQESMSVSHTGLDSRVNTPWGLGAVPHEEEEDTVRPHTAPAGMMKTCDSVNQRKGSGDVDGEDDEEQLSTTGLSDPGGTQDEVIVGIIDASAKEKIIVGQHSFAKLGNRNLNIKMKNREGVFKVKPLRIETKKDKSSTEAFNPDKPKTDYDPVNEKVAMVRKVTNYLEPTIASDMKINNKLPIQKSLKGLEAKRTTVVDIYMNSRDRRARHLIITTRKQKDVEAGDSNVLSQRVSRLAAARAKLLTAFAFKSIGNNSESAEGQFRGRTDSWSTVAPRTSSRVAFAGEDSDTGLQRHSPTRVPFGRSDSQLSNTGPTVQRSDSQLSDSRNMNLQGSHNSQTFPEIRKTKSVMPQTDLSESFNSSHRGSTFSAAATAVVFVNKLRTSVTADTAGVRDNGFGKPMKIGSNSDMKLIVKQQMRNDKELDDQMTTMRRRMHVRSGGTPTNRLKLGGSRLKTI